MSDCSLLLGVWHWQITVSCFPNEEHALKFLKKGYDCFFMPVERSWFFFSPSFLLFFFIPSFLCHSFPLPLPPLFPPLFFLFLLPLFFSSSPFSSFSSSFLSYHLFDSFNEAYFTYIKPYYGMVPEPSILSSISLGGSGWEGTELTTQTPGVGENVSASSLINSRAHPLYPPRSPIGPKQVCPPSDSSQLAVIVCITNL